nr:hypothetical protein [Parcubacteria group bacterium]
LMISPYVTSVPHVFVFKGGGSVPAILKEGGFMCDKKRVCRAEEKRSARREINNAVCEHLDSDGVISEDEKALVGYGKDVFSFPADMVPGDDPDLYCKCVVEKQYTMIVGIGERYRTKK